MKQRIITAIVALAVFVPIVLIGGLPFTLIMYVIGTVGVIELLKMKHLKAMSFPSIISLLLTLECFYYKWKRCCISILK